MGQAVVRSGENEIANGSGPLYKDLQLCPSHGTFCVEKAGLSLPFGIERTTVDQRAALYGNVVSSVRTLKQIISLNIVMRCEFSEIISGILAVTCTSCERLRITASLYAKSFLKKITISRARAETSLTTRCGRILKLSFIKEQK